MVEFGIVHGRPIRSRNGLTHGDDDQGEGASKQPRKHDPIGFFLAKTLGDQIGHQESDGVGQQPNTLFKRQSFDGRPMKKLSKNEVASDQTRNE